MSITSKRLFVAGLPVVLLLGVALAQEAGKAAPAAPPTGTITGVVQNRWVTRYPAVVYVAKIEGKTFTPPKEPAVVDQKGKVFVPRVLPVLLGTEVSFHNADPFEHNVFCPELDFDLGKFGQGESRSHVFDKLGAATLLCKLHPEMIGYVVVCPTPYFAVTDEEGHFTITGVPPGDYTLVTWHERLKPAKAPVEVKAGEEAKVKLEPKRR